VEKITSKLILGFVTLLLGIIFIGNIASTGLERTSLISVSSEGVDITGALNSVTTNVVNKTHGTKFSDSPGMYGIHVLPTITETSGKDLACTEPVVTNASSGQTINNTNWHWATVAQARGRCGIIFNATFFPNAEYNNSNWNFTYTVTYKDVRSTKISIAHAPTGWKADDCPVDTIVLTNGTTTLIDNTDYTYSSADQISLLPTTTNNYTTGTSYTASYSYCPDDYLNLSWGRTGINLVPGFFALGLLIISVGLFYSAAKDTGMLG